MEAKDKIAILLAEYNTLRQEVLAARANVHQGVGVFSAAIMADVAFGFSYARGNPEVPIIIGLLAFLYIWALVRWPARAFCFGKQCMDGARCSPKSIPGTKGTTHRKNPSSAPGARRRPTLKFQTETLPKHG